MNTLRPSAFTALVLTGFLVSGCATLGPAFKPEQSLPSDKGTVYIYRESKMIGGAVSYTVSANGMPLAKLSSGSYFVYHAVPGEVEFSAQTEAKTSVTIDIRAGEAYYVKGSVGMGVFIGHPHLLLVSSDIGQKEIAECKLVPGAPSDAAAVAAADRKQR
jgi:hypothetical protein